MADTTKFLASLIFSQKKKKEFALELNGSEIEIEGRIRDNFSVDFRVKDITIELVLFADGFLQHLQSGKEGKIDWAGIPTDLLRNLTYEGFIKMVRTALNIDIVKMAENAPHIRQSYGYDKHYMPAAMEFYFKASHKIDQ
jgi:hypothetical protein